MPKKNAYFITRKCVYVNLQNGIVGPDYGNESNYAHKVHEFSLYALLGLSLRFYTGINQLQTPSTHAFPRVILEQCNVSV